MSQGLLTSCFPGQRSVCETDVEMVWILKDILNDSRLSVVIAFIGQL